MIAVRMSVAIRLRHLNKRNPLDTYYIATRLKGMGYEHLLPVPLATWPREAMLDFLLHDPVINRGVERLVTVGPIDAGSRDFLSRMSPCARSTSSTTLPPASSLGRPALRQRPQ